MYKHCPLCNQHNSNLYLEDNQRIYWQCKLCQLVFVDPDQRLNPQQEKAEYDLHQNTSDDIGYKHFLNRLFNPLSKRLQAHHRGLDFGCGPGPVLASMFNEAGFRVEVYDPFYANNAKTLTQNYDFITATEVAEHLFEPGKEINRLWRLLVPGGILGLMTKLVIDPQAFSQWHYKNDPTHVCFFSVASFNWLAKKLNARLEIIGNDVILLHKPIESND